LRRMIESTLVSLDGVIGEPRVRAIEYFEARAAAMDPNAPAGLTKKRPRRLGT